MIDYKNIWLSINEESKNSSKLSFIARMIPSQASVIFLATDFSKNIRYLYILLHPEQNINIEELPRFVELDIEKINTTLANYKNKDFLRFSQLIPNSGNIFELVISDITDHIINVDDSEKLEKALNKVLSSWKVFFEKKSTKTLTIQQQKGLFAELYFLKVYLFEKFGSLDSIQFWTASSKSNHDFQIHRSAIEVKSTSGKQHRKFTVSSEKQLDSSGLNMLVLTLFSLNLHFNRPDISLNALINEIAETIKDDSVAHFQFQLKLTKAGYYQEHGLSYKTGISVTETMFFEITDTFPKLLTKDLPQGVGDLKYSVMLSACQPFRKNELILNEI